MFSCYLIVKKERDRDEKVRGYEKKKECRRSKEGVRVNRDHIIDYSKYVPINEII